MTITEKLKLELLIREHVDRHGDLFYTELERILSKLQSEEQQVPPVGRFRMVV
jgi:hypothetical protein